MWAEGREVAGAVVVVMEAAAVVDDVVVVAAAAAAVVGVDSLAGWVWWKGVEQRWAQH